MTRPTAARSLDAMAPNPVTFRYGADYRTVAHGSPQAALAELTRARADGDDVALIIADQWMPEMTGGDLLERAHELHPDAQRALLVAWGDKRASETILQGCALGKLDNYLLKPWAPAEVYLYPIVSAFLAEWTRTHGPRLELIRVVGDQASSRGAELRDVLGRNGVHRDRLPAIILLDGRILHDPTNMEIGKTPSMSAWTRRPRLP